MAKQTVIIQNRKLGKHQARGLYLAGKTKSLIEIDPRLGGEEELDTVIHEALHHVFPYLDEDAVDKGATDMARIVWIYGFRNRKRVLQLLVDALGKDDV